MRRLILLVTLLATMLIGLPAMAQDAPAPPAADQVATVTPEEAPAGDPVLLRFAYVPGDKLTYETTVDGVGSVSVMGQTQAIEMTGKMLVNMLVESRDEEGNFITSTTMDVTDLAVSMAGMPLAAPIQDLQMRTKTNARGQVLEIEMTQAVDQQGEQSPWNSEMVKMLTGGFDLNQMLLGQKLASFPEQAVKPGDEWTAATQAVEVQGQTAPLQIKTRYANNLELNERECAVLDSTMSMDPAALGQLAAMLSMQGSTDVQSRSWFDLAAGRTVASMEKTQVNMRVNLPGALVGEGGNTSVYLEMFVDTQSKLLPPAEEE
jgi:hypothetical protein